ncbi:MAG TPA: thioredoxin family protein [Chitinophagaceae bacterium]
MTNFQRIFIINLLLFFSIVSVSQEMKKISLYKPEEKAETEITKAITEAKKSGKHVLIQIGGNWCSWCIRFHEFVTKDAQLDSLMNANYVVYHLNYSKENYNAKILTKYNFPQRFGFPVFLILDSEGNLLHTQNSWYLEDGKTSYEREKVKSFFTEWSKRSLDPSQYKEQ